MIHDKIPQTIIITIVWQTVRRIAENILGVKRMIPKQTVTVSTLRQKYNQSVKFPCDVSIFSGFVFYR